MDLWLRSLKSKVIQDGLCFPLLIDITEEAGLHVPNCFSTLPDELKLGIMARLPAKALTRMECVCAGLQSLSASSNQMWEGTARCSARSWWRKQGRVLRWTRIGRSGSLGERRGRGSFP
ncbi:unnamed protein product [Linum trigynum]|uniref:F-box domain-containing protein n=1 Tax=Linum trigynum TaxID=586398 RepID=A0AAV2E671_9ROSI